ncbi:MAG: 50S ribosomal protein L9 [Oscillospiraceae bacterium]|jgi:large subunit ribosomal protein L9|nr:50S ribosomal protein L9 [Oscillospiraceae bacterium]
MQVVLLQDVKGSGKKSQVVNVSDGYARNYLLPQKLAKRADSQSLNELKNQQQSSEYRAKLEKAEAEKIYSLINEQSVNIFVKSGEGEKMFGSVTAKDICAEINKNYDIELNKRKIFLQQDIKAFGRYTCEIKLCSDVSAKVYVSVTPIEDTDNKI